MKKHREKANNTGKTQGILSCSERGKIQVDQQTGSGQSQSIAAAAPDVDVHDLSRDAAERLLVDCLTSKQFSRALHLMKNLRYVSCGRETTLSFCIYEAR